MLDTIIYRGADLFYYLSSKMITTIWDYAKPRSRDYDAYCDYVLEIFWEILETGKYVYNSIVNKVPLKLKPNTCLPLFDPQRKMYKFKEIEGLEVEILVD